MSSLKIGPGNPFIFNGLHIWMYVFLFGSDVEVWNFLFFDDHFLYPLPTAIHMTLFNIPSSHFQHYHLSLAIGLPTMSGFIAQWLEHMPW